MSPWIQQHFKKVMTLMLFSVCGSFSRSAVSLAKSEDCKVSPYRELLVVDPLTIEDESRVQPGGVWHFSSLVRQMLPAHATDAQVSRFLIDWLSQWESVRSVGAFAVQPRTSVRTAILCPWLDASTGRNDCKGIKLDLNLAPFRLLGIVNRIDKYRPGFGGAGEGRFVFGALSRPTRNTLDEANSPLLFTVILEYSHPVTAQKTVSSWADAWHALGDEEALPCNEGDCEAYNQALENITRSFSGRMRAAGKTNGNPLNQIRTNEFLYGSPSWQLREFKLQGLGINARLRHVPLQQTPDASLNGSSKLRDYLLDHKVEILAGKHKVPEEFLAGAIETSLEKSSPWSFGSDVSENLRFAFSKATCNGCHREDSDRLLAVDGFFHITPLRTAGLNRVSWYLQEIAIPERTKSYERLICPSKHALDRTLNANSYHPGEAFVH